MSVFPPGETHERFLVGEIQQGQLAALEHAPIHVSRFVDLKGGANFRPQLLQPLKLLAHKLHVLIGGLGVALVEDRLPLPHLTPLPALRQGGIAGGRLGQPARVGNIGKARRYVIHVQNVYNVWPPVLMEV